MTQAIMLATAVAATAGDKSSVAIPNKTPFLHNRQAAVRLSAHGQSGTAPAWAIDGSFDDTTFVELATSAVAGGEDIKEVTVYPYMRVSVTTAAGSTAGTLTASLEPLQ